VIQHHGSMPKCLGQKAFNCLLLREGKEGKGNGERKGKENEGEGGRGG